jgi:hypothetical protein
MTPPQRLLLACGRVAPSDGAIQQFALTLFRDGLNLPGVTGSMELAGRFVRDWEEAAEAHHRVATQLLLYQLDAVAIPAPGRGKLRAAVEEDFDRVARWWYAARLEMFGQADLEEDRRTAKNRIGDGDVFLWDDDGPVSMASKTRPTRHGIGVGMVYTPSENRCRGYATACVGDLSRALLKSGFVFCSLFADSLNPISNGIYQKIGYHLIGEMVEYEFLAKL